MLPDQYETALAARFEPLKYQHKTEEERNKRRCTGMDVRPKSACRVDGPSPVAPQAAGGRLRWTDKKGGPAPETHALKHTRTMPTHTFSLCIQPQWTAAL